MLKTGSEHLESLRDGRVVYIGSERVEDVTTHPGFRNGARSMAAIYDMKRAHPEFSFEEKGEKYSAYFLRAKTKEELEKRTKLHRAIADMSYGLLGRSPDHVSSFVTGMAMNAAVFGKFEDNLLKYYEHMRREDVYGVYAVIPPQAARNPEFYQKQNLPIPTLRVVRRRSSPSSRCPTGWAWCRCRRRRSAGSCCRRSSRRACPPPAAPRCDRTPSCASPARRR
jgi:4-hydroxyphenylacetate 3-monooxygenase